MFQIYSELLNAFKLKSEFPLKKKVQSFIFAEHVKIKIVLKIVFVFLIRGAESTLNLGKFGQKFELN